MKDNKICEKHGCEKMWVKDSSLKAGGRLRCPECRREKTRLWREANRATIREKHRLWREARIEKVRESSREGMRRWRKAHPDKVLERGRRRQKDNPEIVNAHAAVRYAVKTGRLVRTGICWLCNEQHERTQFHHAFGYAVENRLRVVEVCKPCHNELDNVSPEEFAATWKQVVAEASI